MAISNPTKYVTTRRLGRFKEKNDALYAAKSTTYTKTEVDNKLSGKSDTSHNHDSRYYQKSEIDAMRGPEYDEDNRGVIFPTTSASTYDSARRCVVIAV